MGRIETLETRCHLAASPIHLDVPHTSGVDWNPNGILRVIGTSKADNIQSVGVKLEDVGKALQAFPTRKSILDITRTELEQQELAPTNSRLLQVYLIGHLNPNAPSQVGSEQLTFLEGSDATQIHSAITKVAGDEKRVAILIRGRDANQCVLVDKSLVSKIVIEGRRGNDELGHRNYANSLDEANHVPALMLGGRGNDWVSGTLGDTLDGGSGDDMIIGDQCDAMRGGAGDDFLFASSSNFVNGGSGVDRWHGKGTWTHVASIEKITSGLTSIRKTGI